METVKGIVFDMDDVLFAERDYVRSGFKAAARELAGRQTEESASEIFAYLWDDFEEGIRGNSFDRLLRAMPELAGCTDTAELIGIYRDHVPEITPCREALRLLDKLNSAGIRTGLISDGSFATQSRKLEALGLRSAFDLCVLTDQWGREFWKPHARAFQAIADAWGFRPAELIYIGDNPAKDFLAPRRLGWTAVRLRKSTQLYYKLEAPSQAYEPHLEIGCLAEFYQAALVPGAVIEALGQLKPKSGLFVSAGACFETPPGATACT